MADAPYLDRRNLRAGMRVAVAVSGGADSVGTTVADAAGAGFEAFLRNGFEGGFGGRAPQVVEDDVDAVIELGAEGGDERVRGLIEGDDSIGSEGLKFFQRHRVASGSDNAARSAAFGYLYGELTRSATT